MLGSTSDSARKHLCHWTKWSSRRPGHHALMVVLSCFVLKKGWMPHTICCFNGEHEAWTILNIFYIARTNCFFSFWCKRTYIWLETSGRFSRLKLACTCITDCNFGFFTWPVAPGTAACFCNVGLMQFHKQIGDGWTNPKQHFCQNLIEFLAFNVGNPKINPPFGDGWNPTHSWSFMVIFGDGWV